MIVFHIITSAFGSEHTAQAVGVGEDERGHYDGLSLGESLRKTQQRAMRECNEQSYCHSERSEESRWSSTSEMFRSTQHDKIVVLFISSRLTISPAPRSKT